MIKFEGYERRIDKIMGVLKEYGIASLEDAQKICLDKGVDCDAIVKGIQPIAFDNAVWAYTVGCAIAIKKNCKKAADAAEAIGIGLQSFCIPGSVAENRKVGLGHGNLGAMLLSEESQCFATKPNASLSLPVTKVSRRLKAQSVSRARQTKFVKSPCKSF